MTTAHSLSLSLLTVSLAYELRRLHESSSLGFNSHFHRGSFSRSSHTTDLNLGTPAATLPGTWRYRVSTGTGWPGDSIL